MNEKDDVVGEILDKVNEAKDRGEKPTLIVVHDREQGCSDLILDEKRSNIEPTQNCTGRFLCDRNCDGSVP